MKIEAVVFDFGGVMTTSTMPMRVIELAEAKGIDWGVFKRGFDAHRLDYDAGRITLAEMYELIWRDAGIVVDAGTNAAFMEADDRSWCYRNERTLAWMKALKSRGYKIGILTNMAPRFAREHFRSAFADFIAQADAMVISGDDLLTLPLMASGADGLISVMSNAFPAKVSAMVHHIMAGRMDEARAIHQQLVPLTIDCFKEGSPAGVKAIMFAMGLIDNALRLPLVPVSDKLQEEIALLLSDTPKR